MMICEKVKAKAQGYWLVLIQDRSRVYGWLEEHAMECDPCAMVLEEAAQAWSESSSD